MKRIIAFALSVIMAFSFVACDDDKAEKYCSNCGQGVSKDVSFCANCGAPVKDTSESEESSNDSNSIDNISSTESNIDTTSEPTIQIHIHSYSKKVTEATCTQKGYTTYTCSCGNSYVSDYVASSHTYKNYKCSKCGEIDKTHSLEYLINWVSNNGTVNGQYSEIAFKDQDNGYEYTITYDKQNKGILFTMNYTTSNYFRHTSIVITEISNSYYYGHLVSDLSNGLCAIDFSGYIDCATFTKNTPLTYDSYESDIGSKVNNSELSIARNNITLLLIIVEGLLSGEFGSPNNSGLTLKDLGFTSFMDSLE